MNIKKKFFSSKAPTKKKPFQFPPLSSSVDFSQENKNETFRASQISDEEIEKVKLVRPSREKIKEKNIFHSTNFSSSNIKDIKPSNLTNETSKSLQEIKAVEENPYEEFEEEDHKFIDYVNLEKNKSKFTLNNTNLKSFLEEPLKVEPFSLINVHEENQLFYVNFIK